jgi:hypothetical protein
MQEYYIVRQPQPPAAGGMNGAEIPFQQMQFMPPGQVPGFVPQGPGFSPGQGQGFGPGQGPGFGLGFPPGQVSGFPTGQVPGFPPGQVPGFPSVQVPGFPPGQVPGGGVGMGPPLGRPPQFIPSQAAAQQTAGVLAVDPGAIRPCRFRFVYLWLDTGQQFWAWLVFVGRRSVSGWRWTGFNWVFFGLDLDRISSFV